MFVSRFERACRGCVLLYYFPKDVLDYPIELDTKKIAKNAAKENVSTCDGSGAPN